MVWIMNNILLIVKVVLVILIGLAMYKAARAKKADPTIAFKMNKRSWVEFLVIVVLDIFILISFPSNEKQMPYVFFGQLMIVLTFLNTKRYVFAGKKYLYMMEHVFNEKDVRNMYYKKGVLHLKIRNQSTKVRLPITNVDYLLERFAGKKYQN